MLGDMVGFVFLLNILANKFNRFDVCFLMFVDVVERFSVETSLVQNFGEFCLLLYDNRSNSRFNMIKQTNISHGYLTDIQLIQYANNIRLNECLLSISSINPCIVSIPALTGERISEQSLCARNRIRNRLNLLSQSLSHKARVKAILTYNSIYDTVSKRNELCVSSTDRKRPVIVLPFVRCMRLWI